MIAALVVAQKTRMLVRLLRWLGGLVVAIVVVVGAASGSAVDSVDAAGWDLIEGGGVDIPADMAALYDAAAARFAIPSPLLAAVGKVECDHNRNPRCAAPNTAGAVGPMQFLPATFAAWSWASGSPAPEITNPRDAAYAAAALLSAGGAAATPERALWAYNHSHAYAAVVEAWALAYGWSPPDGAALATAVLAHPNIELRPQAAADLRAGLVDDRLTATLLVLATRHQLGSVGPFVTGHPFYVAGTSRPSNHAFGRAVDLPSIDGVPVSPGSSAARAAADLAASLPAALRPDEIGAPWPVQADGVSSVTDGHADHLHLAWRADHDVVSSPRLLGGAR